MDVQPLLIDLRRPGVPPGVLVAAGGTSALVATYTVPPGRYWSIYRANATVNRVGWPSRVFVVKVALATPPPVLDLFFGGNSFPGVESLGPVLLDSFQPGTSAPPAVPGFAVHELPGRFQLAPGDKITAALYALNNTAGFDAPPAMALSLHGVDTDVMLTRWS